MLWIIPIISIKGSELFRISFNQFVHANNIWLFDSVQNLVFVQTLEDKSAWIPLTILQFRLRSQTRFVLTRLVCTWESGGRPSVGKRLFTRGSSWVSPPPARGSRSGTWTSGRWWTGRSWTTTCPWTSPTSWPSSARTHSMVTGGRCTTEESELRQVQSLSIKSRSWTWSKRLKVVIISDYVIINDHISK